MTRLSFLAASLVLCGNTGVASQEVRTVDVEGRSVRVQTAGLERSGFEAPAVVFEAGFMYDGLSAWTAVIGHVAEFAPVVAYDRAGIGGSEPDGEVPTPRHVAENLRVLLRAMDVPPPYVLVGHSLGGPFIRMYAALFPEEVAGLVYVDPSDWMSLEESRAYDRAMGISEEGRLRLNESVRETFPDLPNESVRAEAEMMYDPARAGWPEFQNLPAMPNVPVSVLMAARFDPRPRDAAGRDCAPRDCHSRRIAFRRAWLADLADEVPQGTLTVVNYAGHFIQNEDPELVASTIRRVLEAEPPRAAVDLAQSVLEGLAGTYDSESSGRLTVVLEHDQLFARVGNQSGTPMFPASESLLFFRAVDAEMSVERDSDGEVTGLVLVQDGRRIPFERVR